MNKPIRVKDLKKFGRNNVINDTIDTYENLLDELFCIRNPNRRIKKEYAEDFKIFKDEHLKYTGAKSMTEAGEWFYFPWNKMLIHYLPEVLHQEVRTARNRNIITAPEQKRLYGMTIAIAGLSVGSHAALTVAMMGMAHHIKLADPDEIAASNLNRLHYDFTHIGKNKAEITARYIYQMNPYAKIDIYSMGLTKKNINKFLFNTEILIEEMDNLPMKVIVRREARKRKIPVLMATDNAYGVILDVERYDTDPQYPLFHGRIRDLEKSITSDARQVNPKIWHKIASEIIGVEFMEEDLILSLGNIGRTLSGVPQLGAAAVMSGSLLAFSVFKIVNKKPLVSGKYIFSPEAILTASYNTVSSIKNRQKIRGQFKKFLNS